MNTEINLNNTYFRVKPMTHVLRLKWAGAYSIHRLQKRVVGREVARG